MLDLNLTERRTALDFWLDALTPLPLVSDANRRAPTRIIHDARTPPPRFEQGALPGVTVQRDGREYRGPAGAARDACEPYQPDATVVIADAARWMGADLQPLVRRHFDRGADVTVIGEAEGAPAGLYVARCGVLFDLVPPRGFMDLKEQWLGRARDAGYRVRVDWLAANRSWPLRTRAQLLEASRLAAGLAASPSRSEAIEIGEEDDRAGESWRVIAPTAEVGPGATIRETIVMPGAWVGADAVLGRCVVCPGAWVHPEEELVDSVISEGGVVQENRRSVLGQSPAR